MFFDFSQAFDFIHRGKMEQILFVYSLPKETVTTIMVLYKNTNAMVCSPDSVSNFFDIVDCVLQRDILAPYKFIIWIDYVLRTPIDVMKENDLPLTKVRNR